MQQDLKEKIKKGAKIGAGLGLLVGVGFSTANILDPNTVKNLELFLKEATSVASSLVIGSCSGATGATGLHYLDKFKEYVLKKRQEYHNKKASENYTNNLKY